ncbi:hypothetical protein RBH29_15965, partial [Herbivorax sp. ANBcel31]|uniref:hypothetical protein n=1 Tax=Herbivorax sp. ANBcel31 TaxID=3069754 RepID=UPI0027B55F4F
GSFGVHYRKDTGSGVLTIITLPLLDYKLSYKHDEFKKYFSICINQKEQKDKGQIKEKKAFEIGEDHLKLFMFLAAGIKIDSDIKDAFSQYFNKSIEIEGIKELEEVLVQQGLINSRKISDRGRTFINKKGLKSFIKVLEGRENTDEW